MAGDTKETALWEGADVYIAPINSIGPADLVTEWGVDWSPVGLLDGEAGFVHARDADTSEHYAWGGVLYKRSKSKHKRTVQFSALEDNDVVFGIVNPGSTRSVTAGVRTSTIKVPTTGQFAIGMEVREGEKVKRRWAKVAEMEEVSDITESETDPTVYEITAVIFPESDSTIWHEMETDPSTV
jgi:hypothetical protein